MEIVSFAHAAFVVVAFAAYHALPAASQPGFLWVASATFYVCIAPAYLPIFLVMTLATFVFGRQVHSAARQPRMWLVIGVVAQIGILVGVRYITGAQPFTTPMAALGISFVTLHALSYLFDVAAGRLPPASLADVALYLAYFPKITAGPIERAHVWFPRARNRLTVDNSVVARAGWLILIGLVRKLAIADSLATLLPSLAFRDPDFKTAAMLGGAILGYGIVLYNDFAGYSGIARGVSLLFGIELSPNFRQPFFATSFSDLWNRWHISLSLWLRDYVYFPVSRALVRWNPRRGNPANVVLPPVLAMTVSGLWHGGAAHLLVWGVAHGVLLAVERAVTLLRPRGRGILPRWRRILAAAGVFSVTILLLVPFRLDLTKTLAFWRRLSTFTPGSVDARLWGFFAAMLWLDWMQERHGETPFDHWSELGRAAAIAVAVVVCVLASRSGTGAPFVYEGF